MVVSTLEAMPVREAEVFVGTMLTAAQLHLGALVCNKVLPAYLSRRSGTDTLAESFADRAADLGGVAPHRSTPSSPSRVLGEVAGASATSSVVARREAEQLVETGGAPEVLRHGPLLRHRHLRPRRGARAGRSCRLGGHGRLVGKGGHEGCHGQLVDHGVLAYADAHTTAPPGHLESVDASTREDFAAWGMMVGRQEGRFLELLVFATQATSVLEIGTFTGYSAIAMAAGLGKAGRSFRSRSTRTTPRWRGGTSPRPGSRATSA